MNKFLTMTIVFKASSLNYGENTANINELKKLISQGKIYSYVSRQALRYDIVRIMHEEFGMPLTPVGNDGKVVQFEKDSTIKDYPEIDFFGYMKTAGEGSRGKIRKAIVRLSDAISLEEWNNDIDYANNMGLSNRDKNLDNMIFQTEIHKTFYTYTLTIDINKLGVDVNYEIDLSNKEKKERLYMLLDAIKNLYRDIKGRRENLSPLFIIGGIYDSGNPFFYNKIQLIFNKESIKLNTKILDDILERNCGEKKVKDSTYVGVLSGIFNNVKELNIEENKILTIEKFFEKIKDEISKIYEE